MYQAHAADVLRYAARRMPESDAKDVFAETFLVAWRRLDEVPNDPLPWLYGVARRAIANTVRSRRRRDSLHEKLASSGPSTPLVSDLDSVAAEQSIIQALAQLRDWDREALTLLAWEGCDYRAAAEAMACPPGRFKVRIHRARKRLTKALQEIESELRPINPTRKFEEAT